MMCYDKDDESFPFSKQELMALEKLLDEMIQVYEKDLNTVDPHKYLEMRALDGKICGILALMEEK